MPVAAITPPSLTDAPAVPDRADVTTFAARAVAQDTFVKVNNIPELRLVIANVAANATIAQGNATEAATTAAASATSAANAAASATASATSAGAPLWVSGTNYSQNAKATSPVNGRIYFRKVAGTSTTDPSADATGWGLLVSGLIPVIVTATTVTAAAGYLYVLTNVAATTVTLPATPLSMDTVGVVAQNGVTTNLILRNGSLLMVNKATGVGLAEDMTYDTPAVALTLAFINSIWRFI